MNWNRLLRVVLLTSMLVTGASAFTGAAAAAPSADSATMTTDSSVYCGALEDACDTVCDGAAKAGADCLDARAPAVDALDTDSQLYCGELDDACEAVCGATKGACLHATGSEFDSLESDSTNCIDTGCKAECAAALVEWALQKRDSPTCPA